MLDSYSRSRYLKLRNKTIFYSYILMPFTRISSDAQGFYVSISRHMVACVPGIVGTRCSR